MKLHIDEVTLKAYPLKGKFWANYIFCLEEKNFDLFLIYEQKLICEILKNKKEAIWTLNDLSGLVS